MKLHAKDDPNFMFLVNLNTHMFTKNGEGDVFVSTDTLSSGVVVKETLEEIIQKLIVLNLY